VTSSINLDPTTRHASRRKSKLGQNHLCFIETRGSHLVIFLWPTFFPILQAAVTAGPRDDLLKLGLISYDALLQVAREARLLVGPPQAGSHCRQVLYMDNWALEQRMVGVILVNQRKRIKYSSR
jgi:hypothetical protein